MCIRNIQTMGEITAQYLPGDTDYVLPGPETGWLIWQHYKEIYKFFPSLFAYSSKLWKGLYFSPSLNSGILSLWSNSNKASSVWYPPLYLPLMITPLKPPENSPDIALPETLSIPIIYMQYIQDISQYIFLDPYSSGKHKIFTYLL